MPNIAIEIATNAKWYHIVTLKMRVSSTSYISVESATSRRPAAVRPVAGPGDVVIVGTQRVGASARRRATGWLRG